MADSGSVRTNRYRMRLRQRLLAAEDLLQRSLPLPCSLTDQHGIPFFEIRRTDEEGVWRLVMWDGARIVKAISFSIPTHHVLRSPKRGRRPSGGSA